MYKSKYTGKEVDERLDKIDYIITAAPEDGEQVTDYVLMASDIAQEITDDADKVVSSKAVKSAINSIESMIVSTLNTPI